MKKKHRASAALPDRIYEKKALIIKGEPFKLISHSLNSCAINILKYLRKIRTQKEDNNDFLMKALDESKDISETSKVEEKYISQTSKSNEKKEDVEEEEEQRDDEEEEEEKDEEVPLDRYKYQILKFKKADPRPPIDTFGLH